MNPPDDPRLLRLHPDDNVLTVRATIPAGERFFVAGTTAQAAAALPLGHKVAAHSIAAGEKIVKYGAPIGSAMCAIAAGEHVHTQNLRSDYIPTYARGHSPHDEK